MSHIGMRIWLEDDITGARIVVAVRCDRCPNETALSDPIFMEEWEVEKVADDFPSILCPDCKTNKT